MKRLQTISLKSINWWAFAALFAYIIFISYRLFFYAYTDNIRYTMKELSYNLIPFETIGRYLANRHNVDFDVWMYNLAGNIAAFAPLGFLLPAAIGKMKSLKLTLLTSFFLITAAEMMQLLSRRGVFDIDDILLNTIGVIIGYFVYKLLKKW